MGHDRGGGSAEGPVALGRITRQSTHWRLRRVVSCRGLLGVLVATVVIAAGAASSSLGATASIVARSATSGQNGIAGAAQGAAAATNGIVLDGVSSANNNVSTALTLPVPNGATAGDVLVASLDAANSPAISPPGGWTLVRSDVNPNALHLAQADYVHVLGTNEPPSYTWNLSAADGASGGILAYGGVDAAKPVDTSSGAVTGTTATQLTAPSITSSQPGDMLIDVTGIGVNRTLTPPTGMAQEYTIATTTSGQKTQILAADQILATAGSSGSRTVTADSSSVGIAQLIALNPAATASPSPQVTITAPADGASVSGTQVTVSASASAAVGIASVQFYLDNTPLGNPIAAPPYALTWDTTTAADGQHVLTAGAVDNNGNKATSAPVTVNVSNNGGNQPTATVSLSSSTPDTDSTLTASAHGSSPINNPVTFEYTWRVNGSVVKVTNFSSSATDSLDLSLPGNGDYGDSITVQVIPNDGSTTGAPARASATVTKPPTGATFEYPLPVTGNPGGLAVGPDGNFWISVEQSQFIEVIRPSGTQSQIVSLPSAGNLGGITAGPDGNIWAAELTANKIAKITVTDQITEYAVPTPNGGFGGIATGSDGNLWFVEGTASKIGRITTAGTVTEFATPTAKAFPHSAARGPDGNIWFCELNVGKIGKITPAGRISEFRLPSAISKPNVITAGPDGNMWFTEQTGKVGRITPTGTITEFKLPNSSALPVGITTGPDGNLWFAENKIGKIGRITPQGAITEFPLQLSTAQPDKITAGPDGNIWFTEHNANKLGRITP